MEEFHLPMRYEAIEAFYKKSQGVEWKDAADEFCSECLAGKEEMQEFFTVPVSDLDYFCCHNLHSLSLRNLLADAMIFFKLHSTWEIFICPSCLRWFANQDSLILHLMYKHFNASPVLQPNPTSVQWCKHSILCTVWKPIDVVSALGMLSAMYLDAKGADGCLDAARLGCLEWPLSQDSSRSKLLAELRDGVEMLLGFQDSSRMLSNHCLTALIAAASHHILTHLDPSNTKPPPFKSLFYCSPLSFRFMENESLSCFVELVKQICKLVQDHASRSREAEVSKDGDVLWTKENLDVVSYQDDRDSFVLDTAKINLCAGGDGGITSWLFEAPIAPSIPLVPSSASNILEPLKNKVASFSECLTTCGMQSDFGSAEFAAWIKLCSRGLWPNDRTCVSRLDTTCNSTPYLAVVDHGAPPFSHPTTEPTKCRQIESDSEMMQPHLELVKLTCELQLLVLQVCRHSAIDLRMLILPLLRSSLRCKLYIFLLGWGYCGIDNLQLSRLDQGSEEIWPEEHPQEHAHSNFKGEHNADSSKDVTTPYKGTTSCRRTADSIFPELDWYERESRAWKTKKNGLFFRIKITDVVKHCLGNSCLFAARSIWEWKSDRNLQYWFCFWCQERFADQVSHMVHMECTHQLVLPFNYYIKVPSKVWQEVSGANVDVKDRTATLDDCVEVDETYSTFLVDVAKLSLSFRSEDQDKLCVERRDLFFQNDLAIRKQLDLLMFLLTQQDPELYDTALVQCFARLQKLKQELSKLCVFDYKDVILRSIGDFLQDKNPMIIKYYSVLASWACMTLKDLLGSIRCPYFPNSVSTELESTGKVIVNFPDTRIGFAYTGQSWRFRGDLPFERKTTFNASYLFAGVSWGDGFLFDKKFSLDEGIKKTSHILEFKMRADWDFTSEVKNKLKQFEADFSKMLHGRRAEV